MAAKLHIIYVPGIGDDVYHGQSITLWLWSLLGVAGHCREMPWAGDGTYEDKEAELLRIINGYVSSGKRVALVGASAGASAVLNAYAQRTSQITGVVLICAKINHPETVSAKTYSQNPAFETSLKTLQGSLAKFSEADKSRIVSYYSKTDEVVPYADTVISGVREVRLPNLRHGLAIAYSLVIGSFRIVRFLKQQTERSTGARNLDIRV